MSEGSKLPSESLLWAVPGTPSRSILAKGPPHRFGDGLMNLEAWPPVLWALRSPDTLQR